MNNLIIDEVDIYAAYSIFVAEGGYDGIVAYPALKTVSYNDWPEEDGVEPDLENPKLASKEFSIIFNSRNKQLIGNFLDLISNGAYHDFTFPELGITRRLRLLKNQNSKYISNIERFTLSFADDFPLGGYDYQEPIGSALIKQTGYSLDDRDLSEYGLFVAEGSDAEIMKMPAIKRNLITDNSVIDGLIYDPENVFFQSKDVSLKLCARATDIAAFWRNYSAFLYDLVRPEERLLYFGRVDEEFPCYYKSSSVREFRIINGEVWCDFNLVLVFTSFRLGGIDYLLAAEDGSLIITEDGLYYIDLGIYGS